MTAPLLLFAMLAQPMLAQQGGAARTVVDLQNTIRKNPEVESNYTELGNTLLKTQNFSEAALVLEAARKKFPRSAQAALSLGVAYYGLRRFGDSVAAFLDAGRLEPSAEQPIAFLARMPDNWGDRKAEIVSLFSGYAQGNPGSALGHFALGRATSDAAELRRAIELNPRMPDAHMELGSVLEKQKDYAGAITSFRRASGLAPKNPVPHYRLARLYARTGDAEKAAFERELHEKLAAAEKAELDRRQAATQHLQLTVRP